jgi:DNA-directed RNA polymerase subunit RPC12/RpoP
MDVVKFKGCKRCGGDLFLERDPEGTYITCLQCSAIYIRRPAPAVIPKSRPRKVYSH